ncbi:hypothetical protein Pcinc_027520 [Petrolisthes cinctipes]|uniref:Uncharacterized protein n=1 Tax=Petrolisthes cinctipes TaxID=88211 RepID=A0AAE1F486_PETCI|nr:hypothetical protein Pcinc_027520 [Petrolisthes cinctipes]
MLPEGPHLAITVPEQHPPTSQHCIPCNMALPTPPLQDMPGHMAIPTPPQQDIDEYYTDELEMNNLPINNLKIQL